MLTFARARGISAHGQLIVTNLRRVGDAGQAQYQEHGGDNTSHRATAQNDGVRPIQWNHVMPDSTSNTTPITKLGIA